MSAQKRRIDDEAVGRAEEGVTGTYNKVRPALIHRGKRLANLSQYPLASMSERQIRYDLHAKITRLALEHTKLRTKPSSDGGASANTIVGKNDQDYLVEELVYIYTVTSELGLNLQKPTDHRELSTLCVVICDKEQLAHLKTFMSDPLSFRFYKGCLFCLQQVGLGAKAPILAYGELALRCQLHQDGDACVWISKRENGWFIGTGRG